jgi:CPA2 family monovalent cation:H+ antiporter-2
LDTSTQYLWEIALIMIVAGISSVIFTRLKFPAVIGYIVAGMLLGPSVLGQYVYFSMDTVNFLANLGIAFLMFSIGLDFNLKRLRKVGSFAILAATVEIGLMFTIGYILGTALGLGFTESIFLAAVMSISSTAIIIKVLADTGNLDKDYVEPIIGILIVEDLLGVVILTLTSPLLTGDVPELSTTLQILAIIVLFIGFSLLLGLAVVPYVINHVGKSYSSETLLLVALGMALGFSLVAFSLGLSIAIGAFLMGVLVSQSKYGDAVGVKMVPLKEVFLAVFFVSVGMLVDPMLVLTGLTTAIIIALVFIVGKTFSVTIGLYAANISGKTAFLAGAGMVAIGEVSFVIANAGVQAGVISQALYSSIIGAAIITMIVLPVSIKNSQKEMDWLLRHLPKRFLASLRAVEGVRTEVRTKLSYSAEKRREVRRQLFWIFVDFTIVIMIQVFGIILLGASDLLEPVANMLHVGVSVIALVVCIALSLPVFLDMLNRFRSIVTTLASSVVDSKSYQTVSGTFVFRVFKKLTRVFFVLILIFTLVPFGYVLNEYQSAWVLIFIVLGVVLGYLLWDSLGSSYKKVSVALTKNLEDQEEKPQP